MSFNPDLKKLPFYDYFVELHGDTIEYDVWAAYNSAAVCTTVEDETMAIRTKCAVLDMSGMMKYTVKGADAGAFLDQMMARKCSDMKEQRVRYVIWTNEQGKVFDDGTVFCFAKDDYVLYCAEDAIPHMEGIAKDFADVAIYDATHDSAALGITGPTAYDAVKAMGITGLEGLKPFQFVHTTFGDHKVVVSRTGFTGDLGFEIWFSLDAVSDMSKALTAHREQYGIALMGLGALEVTRIESGYIIPGLDFALASSDEDKDFRRSPMELNLGWMVNTDRDYYGSAALKAEKEAGSTYHFVGMTLETTNKIYDYGMTLLCEKGGQTVEAGIVTSAAWSEHLQKNVSVVSLHRDFVTESGFWIDYPDAGGKVECVKQALPFFETDRRAMTLA